MNNRTLLHVAALFDHDRLINLLVERNVDLDARNDEGESAYHLAAKYGSTSSLQTLLEADPHHVDDVDLLKCTPLMWAVLRDEVNSVELLVRFKANLSLVDDNGRTALDLARRWNHVEMIKLLEDGLKNK